MLVQMRIVFLRPLSIESALALHLRWRRKRLRSLFGNSDSDNVRLACRVDRSRIQQHHRGNFLSFRLLHAQRTETSNEGAEIPVSGAPVPVAGRFFRKRAISSQAAPIVWRTTGFAGFRSILCRNSLKSGSPAAHFLTSRNHDAPFSRYCASSRTASIAHPPFPDPAG